MLREIPERHKTLLQGVSGVKETDPIPEKVVETYWQYKRLADRIGSGALNLEQVVLIGWLAGLHLPVAVDVKEDNVRVMWDRKVLKKNARIRVNFGGSEQTVTLMNVPSKSEMVVQFDAEADHRRIPVTHYVGLA